MRRVRLAVPCAPAAHDPFDMLGGAGSAYGEQPSFGLGCGYARQLADPGVRELATRERLGQERE